MSKLSNSFIKTISALFSDERAKEMLGESYSDVKAVVEAAVGTNDTNALTKIILTLIPGITILDLKLIKDAVNNPTTLVICTRNTIEGMKEQ